MQVETLHENYTIELERLAPMDNFPRKIDQSINRIIEKEGFTKYKINQRCTSTNGGNYLGHLYEIDIKGPTTAGEKELNLFVKNILTNHDSIKILSLANAYKTEVFIYKELGTIFKELQEEANIPSEERYTMAKVYEETDNDTIILENLSKQGFTTYHRMDVPSLEFLELCIKNLARFHGLSFVLKDKRPNYFNEMLKPIKHPSIINEDYKELIKDIAKTVIKKFGKDFKEKLEKLYKNLYEKFSDYCSDETIKICLCHGDYRPNNIMMKIENDKISPIKIILIDYQLNHYGCPVFDFLFLIYMCTDREFRKAHMSNLKDLYDTLENYLKYFDVDAQKVYPRKEFEKVYEEKLDYGLLVALHLLPFMFASENDVPDITTANSFCFEIVDTFKKRLSDIIEEFTDWGYI